MRGIQLSEEGKGSVYVVVSAALWGMFPILAHEWAKEIPPLFFGGILSIFAALGVSVVMFARKESHELLRRVFLAVHGEHLHRCHPQHPVFHRRCPHVKHQCIGAHAIRNDIYAHEHAVLWREKYD